MKLQKCPHESRDYWDENLVDFNFLPNSYTCHQIVFCNHFYITNVYTTEQLIVPPSKFCHITSCSYTIMINLPSKHENFVLPSSKHNMSRKNCVTKFAQLYDFPSYTAPNYPVKPDA